jgi:hypothetical protein
VTGSRVHFRLGQPRTRRQLQSAAPATLMAATARAAPVQAVQRAEAAAASAAARLTQGQPAQALPGTVLRQSPTQVLRPAAARLQRAQAGAAQRSGRRWRRPRTLPPCLQRAAFPAACRTRCAARRPRARQAPAGVKANLHPSSPQKRVCEAHGTGPLRRRRTHGAKAACRAALRAARQAHAVARCACGAAATRPPATGERRAAQRLRHRGRHARAIFVGDGARGAVRCSVRVAAAQEQSRRTAAAQRMCTAAAFPRRWRRACRLRVCGLACHA